MKKVKLACIMLAVMLVICSVSCADSATQSQEQTSQVSSQAVSAQASDAATSSQETKSEEDVSQESIASVSSQNSEIQTGVSSKEEVPESITQSKPQASTVTSVQSKPNTSTVTSTQSKPQTSTVTSTTESKPESKPDDGPQYFGETFTEGDDNFSATDLTTAYSSEDTKVELKGDTVKITGSGVSFADKRISVTAAGTYVFSGTLNDGQIYVNVSKEEKVHLVFDGVTITNSTSACVYVDSCDKTVITLAEGSKNTLTDCSAYIFPSPSKTKPNACVFSDDDLTVNGSGSLTVNARYNNGIGTDNDLTIVGATVKVTAVNNALKGDYSFTCKDADITIVSDGDGIKVDDDYRKDKGYIYIESGKFNITAVDDAIQAVTSITVISGTKITTDCDGDRFNCGDTGIISVPDELL